MLQNSSSVIIRITVLLQAVHGYRQGSVPNSVMITENRRLPKIGDNSADPQ